jgi:hypothetical protein
MLINSLARWHALVLIMAVFYCPFAWMIPVSDHWGTASGFLKVLLSAPAAWFAFPLALAGIHPDSSWWLPSIAPIQILLAAWLASRNLRWALVASVVSFPLAAFGSFFFYGGYRM